MGKIATLYTVLVALVIDELGVYSKSDTGYYEQIPAIGFGIPTINSVGVLGDSSIKDVSIPVDIVDAGSHDELSISIAELYESFEGAFRSKIVTYLTSNGLSADKIDFGDFSPKPLLQDDSIRGLSGSVTFRINI